MDAKASYEIEARVQGGGIFAGMVRHAPLQPGMAHAHSNPRLVLLLAGTIAETCEAHGRLARRSTLIYRPPGERHHDVYLGNGARYISIDIEGWREPPFELHQAHLAGCSIAMSDIQADGLEAAMSDGDLATVREMARVFVEALRTRRMARAARSPWLSSAERQIARRRGERIPIAELAASVGVHPMHLAKRFRAVHGEAIGAKTRRDRVGEALRRLMNDASSIGEIAAELGFADHSHFSRIFRSQTGLTPREFRALASKGL